jgi:hypothetical protein
MFLGRIMALVTPFLITENFINDGFVTNMKIVNNKLQSGNLPTVDCSMRFSFLEHQEGDMLY